MDRSISSVSVRVPGDETPAVATAVMQSRGKPGTGSGCEDLLALGLTPRAIVEKFAAIQMVDIHVPTADGRHLVLARHTQPNQDYELLLRQLDLTLPTQPAPKLLS